MSPFRAWIALVWLALFRQARARQMVWIALGLLVLSVGGVAFLTAMGRWGVSHWEIPRRSGVTFPVFLDKTQLAVGTLGRDPVAAGLSTAVLGPVRAMVTAGVQTVDDQPFAGAGFAVFSRTVVFLVFLTFLLPLWSLSFATEAIGGERENRSLIWMLTRPMPRWAMYLARWVALLPWAIGLNVGGFLLLCLASGPPGYLAFQLYWPAVWWASLAFASLFLLIGAVFRRPAVVAILYSFCLEMVMGNMPGYLKRLSISFYARCLMMDQAAEYGIEMEQAVVFLPVSSLEATITLASAALGLLLLGMIVFSYAEYSEGEGA
jgi:ABC-type transport system involved in multi-copper enzyme maturation permease subunit